MKSVLKLIALFCLGLAGQPLHAESMSVEQVLQRVVMHYPSLKTAAIQVERARQGSILVENRLDWRLAAQGGISRDVGLLGVPADRIEVGGSLTRSFESGSSLGLEASASHEDSESVFIPSLPNPVINTSVELNFRQPLAKGADNPDYAEGLARAEAEVIIAGANNAALYDQLAAQVIEIYMAAATTQARISNKQRAVNRAERLQQYIRERAGLGVSEDKDVLQADAQLKGLQAELTGLHTLWQQQRISLNRLMGRDPASDLLTEYAGKVAVNAEDFDALLDLALKHAPGVQSVNGRIQLADSAIRLRRDARQDNLDIVLFAGNRTQDGDSVNGEVSESELVGGVRLEFSQDVNKSGLDAELYQAQLDRSAAIEDKRQLIEDLQYALSSLLAEIDANRQAIVAYQESVHSEGRKYQDAAQRYRSGRTDTDQLIQFEDQQSRAELSLELQRIELATRYYNLELMLGLLWKNITLPVYDNYVSDRDLEKR